MDVTSVDGGPAPPCGGKCQVQRILADHTDRCHGCLNSPGPIMAVHKYQVGINLIPTDDVKCYTNVVTGVANKI